MAVPLSLFIIIAATLLALAVAIAIAYWKFPLHLIYKSKVGYESMLDAINDPLAVVTSDYIVKRANKAYISLVAGSFQIPSARNATTCSGDARNPAPTAVCHTPSTLKKQEVVEHSPHPSGKRHPAAQFFTLHLDADDAGARLRHRAYPRYHGARTAQNRPGGKKPARSPGRMRNLKLAQRNISEDLRLARQIQEGILPKAAPDISRTFRIVAHLPSGRRRRRGPVRFHPLYREKARRISSAMRPATALPHRLSAPFRKCRFSTTAKGIPPHELIAAINRDLFEYPDQPLSHLFSRGFQPDQHTFTFSRAGHPDPRRHPKRRIVHQLKSMGTFAGVIEDATFEEAVFSYQGDRFFLFTDGIYEIQKEDENITDMTGLSTP